MSGASNTPSVLLSLTVHDMGGRRHWYSKEVQLPGVPRAGDRVELSDGGWTETVEQVWWNHDGSILIEFPAHATQEVIDRSPRGMYAWAGEEDLAGLLADGWTLK